MPSDADRIHDFLTSRHPCIRICTHDEPGALAAVRDAAARVGLPVHVWSAIAGLTNDLFLDATGDSSTHNAAGALFVARRKLAPTQPGIMVFLDLADHLSDPRTLRALRELVHHCGRMAREVGSPMVADNARVATTTSSIILIDHNPAIHTLAGPISTPFEPTLPDAATIESTIRNTLARLNRAIQIDVNVKRSTWTAMINNLHGLSLPQIDRIVSDAVFDDRALRDDDLPDMIDAKRKLIASDGVLEHVNSPTSLSDIGGLDRLKTWLNARSATFSPEARDFGLTPPRGVLLLGVQGSGKSLCAKAISTAWSRPLLRLDPGTLYDRYVGESERRLRQALQQAEAMAPIVLWVDEIEKAFASAASRSTDGGLSQRMFGTLLTWMQERRAPVFFVATANDIEALPPELLRKGRFDEIFFVDLPGLEARHKIFSIHLAARKRDPKTFDLARLAAISDGYSGAEIEQAIIAALTTAFATKRPLDTALVEESLSASPALSVTMAEKIDALRTWAKGRTVPAE